MCNIAVLVSGGGTNLQALIDSQNRGEIKNGKIVCVIASRADAYALTRAKDAGIATEVVVRKDFANALQYDDALLSILKKYNIDLIVLAGFMSIIGKKLIESYDHAIINVHPSLIPSFCGKGCYGLHVHEMALEYGVKVTGATVHFVNEVPDGGEIILQKSVEIEDDDTPQILQKRVMEQAEWHILPRAVSLFCEGRLEISGRTVLIK